MIALENILAMFPLGLCMMPGERLKLHIFEPRYIQLIEDCVEHGINFGIPYKQGETIGPFGTVVKLVKVIQKYHTGELDIEVEGIGLFKIKEFYETMPVKLYSGAVVYTFDISNDPEAKVLKIRSDIFYLLAEIKGIEIGEVFPEKITSFELAKTLDLSHQDKYHFISCDGEIQRLLWVKNQIIMQKHLIRLNKTLGMKYLYN